MAAYNDATHNRFSVKCPSILTNSKRQSPECNKTKRENQAKLVFTELVEVYGFIGGGGMAQKTAKSKFSFWTVAICKSTGVHN